MAAWNLTHVAALDDRRLNVEFRDGSYGVVPLHDDLFRDSFARLADPAYFLQVRIKAGVPTWPEGEQLAPDALWEDIQAMNTSRS